MLLEENKNIYNDNDIRIICVVQLLITYGLWLYVKKRWLPKSTMRPSRPGSSNNDCILIIGISRPKLAAILLSLMLLSLFLTFHLVYDSAVYHVRKEHNTPEHRLTLFKNGKNSGISKPISNLRFTNHLYFPKVNKRLPQALIIGVRKCGTRALLEMLYLHPRIQKAGGEVHFFDRDENYVKGLEWYRKKMPHSFYGQITIEKSPSYFVSPEVPERVRAMNSSIKLLLIVREPVTRAISDYTQLRSHVATVSLLQQSSAQQQQQQQRSDKNTQNFLPTQSKMLFTQNIDKNNVNQNNNVSKRLDESVKQNEYQNSGGSKASISEIGGAFSMLSSVTPSFSRSFEELAIFPNGTINESYRPLTISMYHLHLHRWLEVFSREQLLVVNGDQLIEDPVSQLYRIEEFLGIEHRISSNHFYFNETKGFYCLRYDNGDRCLRETKGRKHPHVNPVAVSKLRRFFSEHNQRFYELIGEDFGWPEE